MLFSANRQSYKQTLKRFFSLAVFRQNEITQSTIPIEMKGTISKLLAVNPLKFLLY